MDRRKLLNISLFALVASLVEIARWGATDLTWSLTIPYPTPSFVRNAFPTLDHNFYRPQFAEIVGVVASLVVLLACLIAFYPGSSRYLISVNGRFRVDKFCWGACACLFPWAVFFFSEIVRNNSLSFGRSWSHAEVWLLASVFIGLQAFTEEYVFRGYLLAGLFSLSRSYLLSACLSSLAFALVHQPESLAASAIPFIFGLLCCEFRRISGGMEFSFGYHFVWNAVSETGIMPNFQWYDNSYGTLYFINQINGWSVGALYLGGLLLLLFARLCRGQYATRMLMLRGTARA